MPSHARACPQLSDGGQTVFPQVLPQVLREGSAGFQVLEIGVGVHITVRLLDNGDGDVGAVVGHALQVGQQIAEDKGFTVHLFECGEGDHVHCFVSAPPKLSITAIVKYLKGITGRKLFERFPEIRDQLWKGELWNHSYYVETIGSVSEENIRRYIEHQSKSY